MKTITQRTAITYSITFLAFGLILLLQYRGSFTSEERYLFMVLILAYAWISMLVLLARIRFGLRLFEPLTIVTVIYAGIFILKPIADLRQGELVEHGIHVLPGGPKATALFVIGYTTFYIAYYLHHRRIHLGHSAPARRREALPAERLPGAAGEVNVAYVYVLWAVVYALCLLSMLSQGLSLRFIFSFGLGGERTAEGTGSVLLFLSNFGITLAALWVILLDQSRNLIGKVITTALCAIYVLMRNARWLALVFLAAPVTLYYLKRDRQPKLRWVLLAGVGALALFGWMQANRYGLARGRAMEFWTLRDFTLSNLMAPLESDLSTYRAFYSMVERFPAQYSYLLGKTFLYTVVMFVPRALWPGKPGNPVRDMIEHALNSRARASGTAVANLGELYANFGLLGIILGMYLLGWALSALKRRLRKASAQGERDFLWLYAILYPLLFQWVARGNFCGNFYLTLFACLPYWVGRLYQKKT